MVLTESYVNNLQELKKIFESSTDVHAREFCIAGHSAAVFFLEGTADQIAQRDLMSALLNASEQDATLARLVAHVIPVFAATQVDNTQACTEGILKGDTVLILDGEKAALILATASWEKRSITEPPTSTVLKGPREGFTEDLKTNLTQIRRRLQTPNLTFKHVYVGKYSHTDVAIIFLKGVVSPSLVREVEKRITAVEFDGILDINYLVEAVEPNYSSFFPQTGSVEKPDILVAKILEGRVAVLINGSPIAMTLPFVLFEEFQQAEDYYTRKKNSSFLRILRIFGALLGIFLPGAYVAVQIFHYSAIPISYLYTIMNAVQGLPMSPIMEMIFVLLIFEILHEASFRMPKYVGMAMSVVGALVLGDTAVKAGLISSPSIMIVALSAISLYAVPSLVNTFKILRLVITLVAGFSGLWGIVLFSLGILLYLASIDTYGAPYLSPFAPLVPSDLQDGVARGELSAMTFRPLSFSNHNRKRRGKGGLK